MAQQFTELTVLTLWCWMLEPWRPGWPGPAARLRRFFAFSSAYSLSQLVNYAALNLDKVMIPLALGAAGDRLLGLYSQAFNLMMRPVGVLTSPLTGVMVAGLARARDNQAMRTELATKFFRLASVGLFPCAVGLALVAQDAMLVLGGQKWSDAGLLLACLAPSIVAQGLNNLGLTSCPRPAGPGSFFWRCCCCSCCWCRECSPACTSAAICMETVLPSPRSDRLLEWPSPRRLSSRSSGSGRICGFACEARNWRRGLFF